MNVSTCIQLCESIAGGPPESKWTVGKGSRGPYTSDVEDGNDSNERPVGKLSRMRTKFYIMDPLELRLDTIRSYLCLHAANHSSGPVGENGLIPTEDERANGICRCVQRRGGIQVRLARKTTPKTPIVEEQS